MPVCKFCKTPVRAAPVMHSGCLDKKLMQAAQRICDDYCKYQEAYRYDRTQDDLHELHCNNCVVNELIAFAK